MTPSGRPGDCAIHDFTKASMVDLVVRQLRRTNPELIPADAGTVDSVRRAHAPAQFKRDILETVWREAGPQTLLSTGQGIREVAYDPVWRAALRSEDPALLFEKWGRFEAFAHSRNRLRIDHAGEKRASFQRYTVDGGTPTAPENLLICGLVIALLEEIGCLGLRCEMPLDDGTVYPIRDNGRFSVPDDADALMTAGWTIVWRNFSPRPENADSPAEPPEIALPQSCGSTLGRLIESVARILMRDVARHWKVGELAREAGLSTRSLQRRLRDAELSFSHLIRLVRVHEACGLLTNSDAPITAIGFCAGFSDSAQFSRDFRASMGMTPSDFRAVSRAPTR